MDTLRGHASSHQGASAGIHLETPHGNINKSITFGFEASNNETKYEALLRVLETTHLLGAPKLSIFRLQTGGMPSP